MRRLLVTLLPLLLLGWMATPAAATTVDDVVTALQSDPVYNDPRAENALTTAQATELSSQIEAGGTQRRVPCAHRNRAGERWACCRGRLRGRCR